VRTGHDFLNSPSGVSATGVLISAAETSGTSQDPKLEVTYTLPSIFSFGNWLPF
jgi:hypothetical protein